MRTTLIPLGQVEATIRDLEASEGVPGTTRACTLNLVACVPTREAADAARETLTRVLSHHPGRTLILAPDPDTPDPGMAADVNLTCPAPTATPFCCEQVVLHFRQEALPHAHSAVLPLLVPEVPVALWWWGSLDPDHILFGRLRPLADVLLVDSALATQPESVIQTLSALQGAFPSGALDLIWTRLTPWRELVAQLFDPLDRRPYVHMLHQVTLTVPETAEGTAAALYLIGWLAGRLQWQPRGRWSRGRRTRTLHFAAPTGDVQVALRRSKEWPDRPLVRVRFQAGGAIPAEFAVGVHEDGTCAEVSVDVGNTHVRKVLAMHLPDQADALVAALRLNGRDQVFDEALRVVIQFLGSAHDHARVPDANNLG